MHRQYRPWKNPSPENCPTSKNTLSKWRPSGEKDNRLLKLKLSMDSDIPQVWKSYYCSWGILIFPSDSFSQRLLPRVDPILQALLFFVIVLWTILGVSQEGCKFVLEFLSYFAQLCLMRGSPTLSHRETDLLASIPSDPRTIHDSFHLESETVIYAVCPDIKHAPKFKGGSPIPIYPSRCRHRLSGRRCNNILLRPRTIAGKTVYMPIKPFVFFSPVEWLGRLLSRPSAEEEMDQSWTNARESYKQDPHLMRDIFDGEVLHNFMGPDGKHFSLGNGEGRYVFSVSVDFFNPLSNKQAGKKVSVGLITLVCLNLPPHLRYKPKNIFLAGIIPGPNEPRGTAINHFLRPLVNHFMKM